MIGSIAILAVSTGLLLYWVRYTCLLLIANRTDARLCERTASANRLEFLDLTAELASPGEGDLDRIAHALDRDYRLLTYLLAHSRVAYTMERRMIAADFRLMQAWYGIAKRISASHAAAALREMAGVAGYLATAIGENCEAVRP